MWRRHLVNLLYRSWQNLLLALSSSTLAVVTFSVAIPTAMFLAVLGYQCIQARRAGRDMKSVFKSTFVPTSITVAITAVAWVCLFGWSVMATIYKDHVALLARIGTLARQSETLQSENDRLRNENRLLKSMPPAPVRALPTAQRSELTIQRLLTELRVTCSLRDPAKLPVDLAWYLLKPKVSYLESPMGKAHLVPSDGVHYERTDEEGVAYTVQRYQLPDDSFLMGKPISSLSDYKHFVLAVSAINGSDFTNCQAAELIIKVNGSEILREAVRFVHQLDRNKELVIDGSLTNMKLPN